jgi:hypothetical protein
MNRRIAVKIIKRAVTVGHSLWPSAIPFRTRGRAYRRLYAGASPKQIVKAVAERAAAAKATSLDNIARNYLVRAYPELSAVYREARIAALGGTR